MKLRHWLDKPFEFEIRGEFKEACTRELGWAAGACVTV